MVLPGNKLVCNTRSTGHLTKNLDTDYQSTRNDKIEFALLKKTRKNNDSWKTQNTCYGICKLFSLIFKTKLIK